MVNEGDEGKRIWLMDFIYMYEDRMKKPLGIALSGAVKGRGEM
jgi:hypothetical protein